MRVKCLQVVPAYGAATGGFHLDSVCAKAVGVQWTLSFRFRILIFSGAGDPWVWSSLGRLG